MEMQLSVKYTLQAILLALGLQHKSVESVEVRNATHRTPHCPHQVLTSLSPSTYTMQKEMDLPSSQILGLFHRLVRKFVQLFSRLEEGVAREGLATPTDIDLRPITESVDSELVCDGVLYSITSLIASFPGRFGREKWPGNFREFKLYTDVTSRQLYTSFKQ